MSSSFIIRIPIEKYWGSKSRMQGIKSYLRTMCISTLTSFGRYVHLGASDDTSRDCLYWLNISVRTSLTVIMVMFRIFHAHQLPSPSLSQKCFVVKSYQCWKTVQRPFYLNCKWNSEKKTLKRPIQQENKQTSLIKLFPQLNPSQTNFVKMSVKHFSSKSIYPVLENTDRNLRYVYIIQR